MSRSNPQILAFQAEISSRLIAAQLFRNIYLITIILMEIQHFNKNPAFAIRLWPDLNSASFISVWMATVETSPNHKLISLPKPKTVLYKDFVT